MDSPTLWIGVLIGAAVASLAVGSWLFRRLAAAEARAADGERARASCQEQLRLLAATAVDEMGTVARSLHQIAGDAGTALDRLARADEELQRSLAAASATAEGDEVGAAELSARAEQATGELGDHDRDLLAISKEIERRAEVVIQVADDGDADGRMAEHKAEDLVAAATEAVSAAAAMDDVIRKLQASAGETAELSTEVSTEAERGYRAVHKTLDEIERIRAQVDGARTRIDALGERVAGIGHVVKVIQDITEKTNLLALNASIIAAQAGEHGRSFAVVATEIKALAQRTAASTKEISEQIRGVQEESERVHVSMVDGVAAVGEGFQVAIAAGDALDAIRQRARAAQKRVQTMTRTLRQQNTVAAQVVSSTAAAAERATSFATALRTQTGGGDRLRGAVREIYGEVHQIAALLEQRGTASNEASAAFGRLLEQLVAVSNRNRELRRRLRAVGAESEQSRHLGDDLAAHWATVGAAAAQLDEQVEALRAICAANDEG